MLAPLTLLAVKGIKTGADIVSGAGRGGPDVNGLNVPTVGAPKVDIPTNSSVSSAARPGGRIPGAITPETAQVAPLGKNNLTTANVTHNNLNVTDSGPVSPVTSRSGDMSSASSVSSLSTNTGRGGPTVEPQVTGRPGTPVTEVGTPRPETTNPQVTTRSSAPVGEVGTARRTPTDPQVTTRSNPPVVEPGNARAVPVDPQVTGRSSAPVTEVGGVRPEAADPQSAGTSSGRAHGGANLDARPVESTPQTSAPLGAPVDPAHGPAQPVRSAPVTGHAAETGAPGVGTTARPVQAAPPGTTDGGSQPAGGRAFTAGDAPRADLSSPAHGDGGSVINGPGANLNVRPADNGTAAPVTSAPAAAPHTVTPGSVDPSPSSAAPHDVTVGQGAPEVHSGTPPTTVDPGNAAPREVSSAAPVTPSDVGGAHTVLSGADTRPSLGDSGARAGSSTAGDHPVVADPTGASTRPATTAPIADPNASVMHSSSPTTSSPASQRPVLDGTAGSRPAEQHAVPGGTGGARPADVHAVPDGVTGARPAEQHESAPADVSGSAHGATTSRVTGPDVASASRGDHPVGSEVAPDAVVRPTDGRGPTSTSAGTAADTAGTAHGADLSGHPGSDVHSSGGARNTDPTARPDAGTSPVDPSRPLTPGSDSAPHDAATRPVPVSHSVTSRTDAANPGSKDPDQPQARPGDKTGQPQAPDPKAAEAAAQQTRADLGQARADLAQKHVELSAAQRNLTDESARVAAGDRPGVATRTCPTAPTGTCPTTPTTETRRHPPRSIG